MSDERRGIRQDTAERLRPLNLPARVAVELGKDGLPQHAAGWQGDKVAVEEILEVWLIDDEWWRTPVSRRYVEVVLEGGAHVVLFEDRATGEWFEQRP
ncbi:MAG TPA: hypothetical protein VJ992_01295 [Gemmatimonadales bacterium]|nr:hypothetical protein [Gemmatimonadales bacterium]